jgi:hypothetical protein
MSSDDPEAVVLARCYELILSWAVDSDSATTASHVAQDQAVVEQPTTDQVDDKAISG